MRRRRGLTGGGGQTVIKDTLANDLIDRYNTAVCVCVCGLLRNMHTFLCSLLFSSALVNSEPSLF